MSIAMTDTDKSSMRTRWDDVDEFVIEPMSLMVLGMHDNPEDVGDISETRITIEAHPKTLLAMAEKFIQEALRCEDWNDSLGCEVTICGCLETVRTTEPEGKA